MKLKRLIFICLLMLSSLITNQLLAQHQDSSRVKPAHIPSPMEQIEEVEEKEFVPHDLRIGIDISTLISGALAPVRRGLDLSVEYNIRPKLFLMLEGGNQYFEKENDRIKYISKGNYIRLGVDYNVRKTTETNDHDIFYLGGRIGYSIFEQEVPYYLLNNAFWGQTASSIRPYDGYAVWAEFVTGFKVEVLKNWFLGMGLRLKMFVSRDKTKIEPVQFVPGYAKNYNNSVIDFNYTIYYNIPLNYKKTKSAVYEKKK